MDVKLTAKFYFKGGNGSKTVSWIEQNPRLQQKDKDSDKVIREIPLTAEEVKYEYRRLFIKSMNEGKAITLEDVNKVGHIIQLSEIRDIELTAEEIESDESKEKDE